jgi:hypothetical protein
MVLVMGLFMAPAMEVWLQYGKYGSNKGGMAQNLVVTYGTNNMISRDMVLSNIKLK